ncbi:uncharacterized protein LOC144910177 isoform X1 [Branchiostoma floridae x Branchiostoma belcheri]
MCHTGKLYKTCAGERQRIEYRCSVPRLHGVPPRSPDNTKGIRTIANNMLLLEKASMVAVLVLCVLSLRADGAKKRGCGERKIKKSYLNLAKMRDRFESVLGTVTSASEKADEHVSMADRKDSLLLKVGDLLFEDGRGFSGLRLTGLKLTDLGLDDIQKFEIYMAELELLLDELKKVEETVKEDFPTLNADLNAVYNRASESMRKVKACAPTGNANVEELIKQYKTQIQSASPTVPTRTRRHTHEDSASSSILLRKIRSLVGRKPRQAPDERILQHSQWVLKDLESLLQHDVIATLDSIKSKYSKRRNKQARKNLSS